MTSLLSKSEVKEVSPQTGLQRQLTEVQSHLARDSIRSASSQVMAAVMGLRRLWLSCSSLPQATINSLLALPYELGSPLFPGAAGVIKDCADRLNRSRDAKGGAGNLGKRKSSPLVDPIGPPAKAYSQWNAQIPNARGQGFQQRGKGGGKNRKGKQRAKVQQQPFRGKGGSNQGS